MPFTRPPLVARSMPERCRWERSPTHWHCGMRAVDYLVESRMRENFMSGLGRGFRKRAAASGFAPGPYSTCVLPSCDGLAGESPVRVMAKQPGSWWPAEGETRPSKRHDKAALGGEPATSPYDEEPCSLDMVTMWEPSLFSLGEGHGRRGDLGMRSAYVSTGVRGAEWLHSSSRNRRDPSRHRSSPFGVVALCHNAIAGSGEAYKLQDCEVAER